MLAPCVIISVISSSPCFRFSFVAPVYALPTGRCQGVVPDSRVPAPGACAGPGRGATGARRARAQRRARTPSPVAGRGHGRAADRGRRPASRGRVRGPHPPAGLAPRRRPRPGAPRCAPGSASADGRLATALRNRRGGQAPARRRPGVARRGRRPPAARDRVRCGPAPRPVCSCRRRPRGSRAWCAPTGSRPAEVRRQVVGEVVVEAARRGQEPHEAAEADPVGGAAGGRQVGVEVLARQVEQPLGGVWASR